MPQPPLAPRREAIGTANANASALVGMVGAALVIAALALGRELLVPLALAVLLAFVLAPLVGLLERLRVPQSFAVVLAVLLGAAAIGGVGVAMVQQAAGLTADLPTYRTNLQAKLQSLHLAELLDSANATIRDVGDMVGEGSRHGPAPAAAAGGAAAPIEMLREFAGPVLAPLGTAGIVVVFAIFVLLYREDLRDRLIRLAGSRDLHRTTVALTDAARRLSRLFLAQVALNASVGVVIGTALWLVGMPSPLLWGILAGLMRFVPFLGTAIAVLPPLLLALAVDPGWSLLFWTLGLFAAVELTTGQVFEPLVVGHSAGLSPVSVIVSATFWTFLWGPIGLLLATPLTVCLVVLGRHVPRLEFLDIMLGDRPSLRPEEVFYRRALEGGAAGLIAQARRALAGGGTLAGYLDDVALRGLVLADVDWSREVLESERLDSLRRQVAALLQDLADAAVAEADIHLAPAWQAEGAVLCVAGRGRLDDLAAAMAALALRREGAGAVAPEAGDAADLDGADPALVRLCCVSVLEAGNSAASVRYVLRRVRRLLPGAQVVVGLWHAPADSAVVAGLRAEAAGETIVTSLGELVALCRAAGAAPPADLPAQLAVGVDAD